MRDSRKHIASAHFGVFMTSGLSVDCTMTYKDSEFASEVNSIKSNGKLPINISYLTFIHLEMFAFLKRLKH